MKRPAPPPFVAPRNYRLRRLRDFARMLPVLGMVLFFLPVMGAGRTTGGTGLWLFSVWALLIVAARLMAPGLRANEGASEEAGETR